VAWSAAPPVCVEVEAGVLAGVAGCAGRAGSFCGC